MKEKIEKTKSEIEIRFSDLKQAFYENADAFESKQGVGEKSYNQLRRVMIDIRNRFAREAGEVTDEIEREKYRTDLEEMDRILGKENFNIYGDNRRP